MNLRFHTTGQPLSVLLYHLGAIWLSGSVGSAAIDYAVRCNMGWLRSLPGLAGNWGFSMNGVLVHNANRADLSLSPIDALAMRGVLLGGPTEEGADMALSCSFENVDTSNFEFRAMGYVWAQTALNLPGGPRMPDGGLWVPS